ncbi:putative uncharacterized protein [Waddlia chondrophila 2032/99]|uniref:Uncharacterized protein n=1 Tax=Waddlia chondrophila 2032/99 TaxID=765953 RepID=F8LAL7_9BACT|nr:putative uncharacterized protein [Waddlia chondrophila 2032/99]
MSTAPVNLAQSINQSWVSIEDTFVLDCPVLPEKAPPNSLLLSELSYVGEPEVKSSNEVKKMCIVTKKNQGTIVYFKKCSDAYPPILAQIESAGSASMRLTRGANAARVRPVVDAEGNVVGAASYEILTFVSLSKESLSVGVMVRMGIIDELVARYVRMEDDLHGDQIGIAKDLGIVGLDYDELWYSDITVEIKGARAINNGILAPLPKDLFPVTDKDIDAFPNIRDAQPCHWPTKIPNNLAIWKRFPNRAEFVKLAEDSMAIRQKYYAFLREILIDPEDHLQVMIPSFSRDEEGVAMIRKMQSCIEKRWNQQLLEGLIKNQGFRRFVIRNKTSILEILDHFKAYNCEFAENDATIDLVKVEKRFQYIVKKCMGKDLTMVLYDLGCTLRVDRKQWETYHPSYLKLIDVCEQLESSDHSFPEAFFLFECELCNIALMFRERMDEWNLLIKNITQVVENYRGLVTEKIGTPIHSILIDSSHQQVSFMDKLLDKEKCLAKALMELLENHAKHEEIVDEVQKVFNEYAPIGRSSSLGSVNFFTYTRTRSDDIEQLLKDLKDRPGERAQLISGFFNEGKWNTSGYVRSGSANVMLVRRLVEKALDDFKNEITLEQLRKHELVEICFAIEQKMLDIEASAQKIATLFQKMMKKKATDS